MDEKQVEEDYSQLSIEERLSHKVSLAQSGRGEVYWQWLVFCRERGH